MKKDVSTILFAIFGILVIIALLPVAFIWGWNQLFGVIYPIEYTFWNWLAVSALGVFFRGVKIEGMKK